MELDKIKELIQLLEESNLQKLQIKNEDFSLLLEKPSLTSPLSGAGACLTSVQTPTPISENTPPIPAAKESGEWITSPMVGTFYDKPAPDQPAFVKVGDQVNKESVVCIIEAMKVMNEVKAGIDGVVEEVTLGSGHPVEYGAKLIRVSPL